ncbi:RluA family pseudouridine synthase [Candidatus Tokpelaia sp.]|uniref:RluA family pseudouridine synthase n=1 Tax=Candidatus Tokpelaia sp. TaxID=2233777 RepID=UPI001239D9FF|nr:RluA family pseudouridine synthase [Candidatus Tokpelaia sp.]KAA6405577.1 RluA family pseudouridine synthase [Candidatus Tokpelaia sp.]
MRLDRWFRLHYPDLSFGALQKLLRSGQIRLDGKRAKSDMRVQAGQFVRVPPLPGGPAAAAAKSDSSAGAGGLSKKLLRQSSDGEALAKMLLYEDDKVFIFNKPAGLAVQGGSGLSRHIDGMLEAWRNKKGEKPRLVHRIDRETSGILVVARTRGAAQSLTAAFRTRESKKTYWTLVRGVPRKAQDKISTWLVREKTAQGDKMRVCPHGTVAADHAVSYYRVVDKAGRNIAWLEMEPYTGRTHQLRVHAAYMGHPIIGDDKYFFADDNWQLPGGMQNRLHLHARSIRLPHPGGGILACTAPLPPHMVQSFNLLGFRAETAAEEQ